MFAGHAVLSAHLIDCTSHARLISPYLEESLYRDSSYLLEHILHTFDPRMIVMMIKVKRNVRENGANGDNDNYCSIFLQSSASSSLRDFGKEIAGSKVPGGQADSRSNFPFPRHQSATSGRPQMRPQLCLQASTVSRLQIQAAGPRLWRPRSRPRSKLWRPKASGMS